MSGEKEDEKGEHGFVSNGAEGKGGEHEGEDVDEGEDEECKEMESEDEDEGDVFAQSYRDASKK